MIINISNSNTVFSSFVLDSDFGFKVSVSLKLFVQKLPLVLNYTWNDYNGLVWGQEANPVANKSEYIREGYALRKSHKRLKYKKRAERESKNNVSSTVNCYFFFLLYQRALCRVISLKFSPDRVGFPFSALTLSPGLFTVPLMRMTDLLSRLKFLN